MSYPEIDPINLPEKYIEFCTPWFSSEVQPEQEGYYRRGYVNGISIFWWYFKGGEWYYDSTCSQQSSFRQEKFEWQGLTKNFE